MVLLISASWVAKIRGVSHCCQLYWVFLRYGLTFVWAGHVLLISASRIARVKKCEPLVPGFKVFWKYTSQVENHLLFCYAYS
jgi:hypothetical protein